jgi:multidrug efflux pump subunit AcrA (membrane-fusion protein)
MKKYIIIAIILVLTVIIAYRAYQSYQAKQELQNKPVPEKIMPVKIMQIQTREIIDQIIASGSLQAASEITIYSKVAGKVQKNLVELSSYVKSGDVVTIIDRDEVGYEYKAYEVKSNAKGVVSKILQNPGAAITSSTPLMSLVDIDEVKAVAAVDELKIRFIKPGDPAIVTLQAYPHEFFKARVTNISPVCNQAVRTIDVEVLIKNQNHKLKPGMYSNIEFKEGVRRAIVIPISSVVEKLGKKYVYTELNGLAKSILVTTGAIMGDETEIISGLNGKEKIIIVGADKLSDDDKIKIIN